MVHKGTAGEEGRGGEGGRGGLMQSCQLIKSYNFVIILNQTPFREKSLHSVVIFAMPAHTRPVTYLNVWRNTETSKTAR